MEKLVEKYELLTLESVDCKVKEFNELVDGYIYNGWQPIGGIQVIKMKWGDSDGVIFYQSVVKYY